VPVERIYAALFERHGLGGVNVEAIRKRSSKRELFEYVVSARHASAPAAAAMIAPRRPAVCGASEE
jgi:hypothetical protein